MIATLGLREHASNRVNQRLRGVYGDSAPLLLAGLTPMPVLPPIDVETRVIVGGAVRLLLLASLLATFVIAYRIAR